MNLYLQNFLIEHPNDWKEILKEKPYAFKVIEKDDLVLFKYNQIDSDFNIPLVQEARGIVFDKSDWSVIKHPFHKFFNYGESNAAVIDWGSASIQEKIDGSLIACYFYKNEWMISTNGTIDARDASLQFPVQLNKKKKINSFYDLVVYTLEQMFGRDYIFGVFQNIDKKSTHLFEIATPINRIVVPYKDFKIYYLCSKVNSTGIEYYSKPLLDRFPIPKVYSFNSLEDCVKAAKELQYDSEGYVIVDKNWNRIKIKSPAYIAAHHLRGEDVVTDKKLLNLILANEGNEFLTYFPEFKDAYNNLYNRLLQLKTRMGADAKKLEEMQKGNKSRKEIALWANKECVIPAFIFQLLDKKIENIDNFIYNKCKVEKLLEYIK